MEDHKAALVREIEHIKSINPALDASFQDPVEFPCAATDPEIEALLDMPKMLAIAQSSPFPWWSQRLALLKPKHAKAWWYRRSLIRTQTTKSLEKLRKYGHQRRESALDQLLWREMNAAVKADRQPDFYSPVIRDEVMRVF